MRTELAEAEQGFAAAYAAERDRLPGAANSALRDAREQAIRQLNETGLPHRRMEGWRWTDLHPLTKIRFAPAAPHAGPLPWAEQADPFAGVDPYRIVLVNGFVRSDLSRLDGLPKGVEVLSLSDALVRDSDQYGPLLASVRDGALVALNMALMQDGAIVRIRRNIRVERPIHIVHLCAESDGPAAYYTRNLLIAEPGSEATVLESYAGPDGAAYLADWAADVTVGAGAILRHYRCQDDSAEAFRLETLRAEVERDATYESFLFATGARLSRNEAQVRLAGPGASVVLDGAYLMAGRQVFDTTTVLDHAAPHCNSREVFKGVVDDEGRGVFQGRIQVRKGAQKTDAHQLHKALLLARGAEVDTKPELEIFADDVKCSHGAAIGQLDPDSLFYLRARGIPAEEARALLIGAFVGEALDAISHEDVRDVLRVRVDAWLQARPKGEI